MHILTVTEANIKIPLSVVKVTNSIVSNIVQHVQNFPTRYIHEPWTAPEAVQKSAKCIIGIKLTFKEWHHSLICLNLGPSPSIQVKKI